MCYDLSEADVNEDECSGPYYSNDVLKELDGYVYAEKCNDVHGKSIESMRLCWMIEII